MRLHDGECKPELIPVVKRLIWLILILPHAAFVIPAIILYGICVLAPANILIALWCFVVCGKESKFQPLGAPEFFMTLQRFGCWADIHSYPDKRWMTEEEINNDEHLECNCCGRKRIDDE